MNYSKRIAFAVMLSLLSVGNFASAQVVFSGTVVDLQGNPRINVPVTVQVLFQNGGRPINAFDANNPEIVAGRESAFNQSTGRFFLPIRTANIPSADAGISLRFIISGQIISDVNFLSALNSLTLDVVVPDPKPTNNSRRRGLFHHHRRR